VGRNRLIPSSWKLETSTAIAPPVGTEAMASMSGHPMFPAAAVGTPPSFKIAATRLVVVVLPLVPVTAMKSQSASLKASSISL
jgi:hypothetical protein